MPSQCLEFVPDVTFLPRLDRRVLILAVLLALSTGCRSNDDAALFHPWGWESAKQARFHLNSYKHILVVRVDEDYSTSRGPYGLTPRHFRGTVIKSYKGDWKVSEKIAFVHFVDALPSQMPPANAASGQHKFVFTNEHTNREIPLDTGEFGAYREESMAPALASLYP